jgi:DNA polymerase-3 subunit beta
MHKQICKALKLATPKKCTLPILENLHFTGDTAEVTDLETSLIVPFKANGNGCINGADFLRVFKNGENVSLTLANGKAILYTSEKETIKLIPEESKEFPMIPAPSEKLSILTESDINKMITAAKFVSTDELRPGLCCVNWGKDIVSTDGQRLYFEVAQNQLEKSVLINTKAINLLKCFGGDWEVFIEKEQTDIYGRRIMFQQDGINIITRLCEESYVNYEAVIPIEFTGSIEFNVKELKRVTDKALIYASNTTKQIKLSINGSLTVSAEDIDFGREYSKSIDCVHTGNDIEMGFNGDLLKTILSQLGETAIMTFSTEHKAVLFDKRLLLMPMRLKD